MAVSQNPQLAEAIAGALDWWREAGVDSAHGDEPVAWLAQREEQPERPLEFKSSAVEKPPERVAPPAEPGPDLASIPATLDAFTAWWMSEPALAAGGTERRVAPRGNTGAELMVIVPEPEPEDSDTLLSGPQGKLLTAMLGAFGLDAGQVYLASALPRHLPGADWGDVTAMGMGDVLTRHIALAAPKRLAVFGATVLPLLSHSPPQAPADLQIFNHEGVKVPMLACRSLAALLQQPRWKARVWQAWLEMTA